MRKLGLTYFVLTLFALLIVTVPTHALHKKDADPAFEDLDEVVYWLPPVAIDKLYAIYADRSWIWKHGSAYFGGRKKKFIAWAYEDGEYSYAEGNWFLTKLGKLCFRAPWISKTTATRKVTVCFEHRTDGDRIYQRRLPDGKWYIFTHWPSKRGDEIRKLRRGNYAQWHVDRLKRKMGHVQ